MRLVLSKIVARVADLARAGVGGVRPGLQIAAAVVSIVSVIAPAWAEEDEARPPAEIAVREVWAGAETYRSIWATYSGLTYAPDGVTQPGLRLRVSAGMSNYTYTASLQKARAAQPFADAVAGYQWQIGDLTLKAFGGLTGHADIRTAEQALDFWGQSRIGPKGVLETWWRVDAQSWVSADLAYAGPQRALWSRLRLGHRLWPQLSVGVEGGLAGQIATPGARVGGFVRYEWAEGEIALSGGIAGDSASSAGTGAGADARAVAPYATLLWLQRF